MATNSVPAVRGAGASLAATARRIPGPARAVGAAAAGLAGGLALGAAASQRRGPAWLPRGRRPVLGLPVGRRRPAVVATGALVDGARKLGSAIGSASEVADEVHRLREELEQSNRRSPVEVLLDGLTHRRGAHRREG